MVFWEHKMELVCSLSVTEETEVIVSSIEDDVWKAEDEKIGSFIDGFESWDWLCL